MVRFSLAPAFRAQIIGSDEQETYSVQRRCGHYEAVKLPVNRGLFDRLIAERRNPCVECLGLTTDHSYLAMCPRLRIMHAYGVWGIERLMATTKGIAWHVVAFLSSHEECMVWIGNTFGGRPWEVVSDVALQTA